MTSFSNIFLLNNQVSTEFGSIKAGHVRLIKFRIKKISITNKQYYGYNGNF